MREGCREAQMVQCAEPEWQAEEECEVDNLYDSLNECAQRGEGSRCTTCDPDILDQALLLHLPEFRYGVQYDLVSRTMYLGLVSGSETICYSFRI